MKDKQEIRKKGSFRFAIFQKRYLIAIAIGVVIGVLAMMTAAEFPHFDSWEIPRWDSGRNTAPGPMLDLEHKALLLRFCKIFFESGDRFIGIPVLLCLAGAAFNAQGKRSIWIRRVSICFQIALYCSAAVAMLWSFSAARVESGVNPTIECVLLNGWSGFLFLFVMAWGSGIAPLFFLGLLLTWGLVMETKEFYCDDINSGAMDSTVETKS